MILHDRVCFVLSHMPTDVSSIQAQAKPAIKPPFVLTMSDPEIDDDALSDHILDHIDDDYEDSESEADMGPSSGPTSLQSSQALFTFSQKVAGSKIIPKLMILIVLSLAAASGPSSRVSSVELFAGCHSVTNGVKGYGLAAVSLDFSTVRPHTNSTQH